MRTNVLLDLIGMYNDRPDIFDKFTLPARINKEVLIDNLLMESAELEVLYSNPDFMKEAVGRWSAMMKPKWEELIDTTEYEYNPIWNKDGVIRQTETISDRGKTGNTVNRTTGETDTVRSNSTTEDESTRQVAGYNSEDFVNSEHSFGDGSTQTTTNGNRDITEKETGSGTNDNDRSRTYESVEQGNIGVTTTQTMIKEQREVVEFVPMMYIINEFKNRFLVLVY